MHVLLGETGLRVSDTALGTLTFGVGDFAASAKACGDAFEAFVEGGGNLFDTSPVYGDGQAQGMLAALMGADRDRFIVVSKVGKVSDSTNPNSFGLSAKNIELGVRRTLSDLGTDYLDVLLVHIDDPLTPVSTWIPAIIRLIERGHVHHWGVSNVPVDRVARAAQMAAGMNCPMAVGQYEYSVVTREAELDLIPATRATGASVLAWSPLCGGRLTGRAADLGSTIRKRGHEGRLTELETKASELIQEEALDLGVSPAAVALDWVRSRGVLPVVSASSGVQMRQIMEGRQQGLSPKALARLDGLAAPPAVYPRSWLRQMVRETTGDFPVGRLGGESQRRLPREG